MLHKLFVTCLMLSALALAGCNEENPQPQGFKVAIIEGQGVFEKSKLAQDGIAYAEELSAKLNARRDEMAARISEASEDQALQARLQQEYTELQMAVEAVQRGIGDKIYKLFEQTVADYRKSNNIDLVLHKETVVSIDEAANITAAVAELMDKASLNLREDPLPAGLNPAPAAPDQAAPEAPAASEEPAKPEE